MLTVASRNLVWIAFAFGSMSTAYADPEWGIHVTGDSNTACELKKPFRISKNEGELGDIWVGFYWLREESAVPGHTLPADEIILIIKTEQDLDDIGDEYDAPAEAYIGQSRLKKYQFDAHVGGHAFFFVDGNSARDVLETLKSAATVDIRFEFEDKNTQVLQARVREEDKFEIFAAMFLTCGEAIRR